LLVDRKTKAQTFGFARPSPNSNDAMADRDFALELSACVAIAMTHLSHFCVDVLRWASQELRFIKLAETWRTGSSIMLQKQNSDFVDFIRSKSAHRRQLCDLAYFAQATTLHLQQGLTRR
jgi:argininosuccinate lyase